MFTDTELSPRLHRATGNGARSDQRSVTVLVPALNLRVASEMIELAATLALGSARQRPQHVQHDEDVKCRVAVLGVVEVPPDQPLTSGLDMARSYRALLDFLPNEIKLDDKLVRVEHIVKVARDVPSAVRQAALEEHASLALFYWKGYARRPRRHTYGQVLDAVIKDPPCDTALVRPEGWHRIERVLLPVRGGPAAERALDMALAVAGQLKVPLAVFHNVPASPLDKQTTGGRDADQVDALGEAPYLVFNEHLRAAQEWATIPIESTLTKKGDPTEELLREARKSDLIIMGLPSPVRGSVQEREEDEHSLHLTPKATHRRGGKPLPLLVAAKETPLILLRAAERMSLTDYSQRAHTGRVKRVWSDMPFEHWFVENTYHADEFRDPDEVLKLKKASGLTISVALLTSNDGRQMYSALTGLRRVLQEICPIADQIAVIDAGSSDRTLDIARSLGAEVYSTEEILPDMGDLHGRGESWWKSLAVLRGDVIVWLDPRARRFHPSAALSLAGPLLRMPALQFVKAFAPGNDANGSEVHVQRNRQHNGPESPESLLADVTSVNWGGSMLPRRNVGLIAGRIKVQALKPSDLEALDTSQLSDLPPHTLLQVLYPPLAGVIAPFGRDMAGRRKAMMSVPAFIGDNLDAGLLLSVATQFGTRAIAQVEMRRTRPVPPPVPNLHNNLETLQVLAHRLPDAAMRECAQRLATRLESDAEGKAQTGRDAETCFEVRALGPVGRPPMATLGD